MSFHTIINEKKIFYVEIKKIDKFNHFYGTEGIL